MSTLALIENLDADQIKLAIQTFWIIPAGMLALYFYGAFHFNTPDYRIAVLQSPDVPALLTLAPPKYTTSRTRFRRYARGYILILECAFLGFVLFTGVVSDAARALNLEMPRFDTETLQAKAIFALFFLTGLLSSFPGFKDVDAWILTKLHKAALIPDDAKLMASRLFHADYRPSEQTRAQVKQVLKSRDTIRYSEGKVVGALEARILSLLWLRSQLAEKTDETECAYFTSKFEIDLADIAKSFTRLRGELLSYLQWQEKLVPQEAADIDQYISDHIANEDVAALAAQRKDLLERCDGFYYRMCLLTSLLVYSTEDTADDIGEFLFNLGFGVKVQANPIMDWDAVFRVVGSVFVLMLAINALFMGIFILVGGPSSFAPERSRLLIFALSTTLLYFVVIYAALKIKRHWRRLGAPPNGRPENPLIGILCYLLTLPISVTLSYWVRGGEFSIAPLLFAANQGIVGYFIATYIDRSLSGHPFSWNIAAAQAAAQLTAALFVYLFAPPVPGVNLSAWQQLVYATFFACQAGLAGFLVGSLFQYFYRRTSSPQGQVVGDITVQLQPAI